MKNMQKVVLPIDGCSTWPEVEEKIFTAFENEKAEKLISHIKINDVTNMYGEGSRVMERIQDLLKSICNDPDCSDVKIFLDLKLSDTSGTNINYLKKHYLKFGLIPDILTVRARCSAKTFKELKELLPNTTLAVVSVTTDVKEEECEYRNGNEASAKVIAKDVEQLKHLCPDTFTAVVCSPFEVAYLKECFPEMKFIVPGIRDEWMDKGQQERCCGVVEAFGNGADLVVMGSQLTKGNPENGISAEKSVELTVIEFEKIPQAA